MTSCRPSLRLGCHEVGVKALFPADGGACVESQCGDGEFVAHKQEEMLSEAVAAAPTGVRSNQE